MVGKNEKQTVFCGLFIIGFTVLFKPFFMP